MTAGNERSSDSKLGDGDPSNPFDFSRDKQFHHLFYRIPEATDVKAFASWLSSHKNSFVRLFHGTSPRNKVMEQGLLPTSVNRRNSLQSAVGFVCLSVYPGAAHDFGSYASANQSPDLDGARVAVYPVVLTVRSLLADRDQLANRRAFAGEDHGNTLAESLVFGRGARVRGRIEPVNIGFAQRYVARDVLVADMHKAVNEDTSQSRHIRERESG